MTEEKSAKACRLRAEGLSYRKIAAAIGMSASAIRYILDPKVRENDRLRCTEYGRSHKEERSLYNAKYAKEHKEERRLYNQAYKERACLWVRERRKDKEFREKGNLRCRNYYKAHKEEFLLRNAEWRKTHKEEMSLYYEANKGKIRLYNKEYRKEHKPEFAAWCAARNAIKLGVTMGNLAEIKEIYRKAKEDPKVRCYLCGKLIPKGHRHVDHIAPLSKHGAHRPSNLAAACDSCNLSKHDKMPNEVGVLL